MGIPSLVRNNKGLTEYFGHIQWSIGSITLLIFGFSHYYYYYYFILLFTPSLREEGMKIIIEGWDWLVVSHWDTLSGLIE